MMSYSSLQENLYCAPITDCLEPDVLAIGTAIPLCVSKYLLGSLRARGVSAKIVYSDMGPMDLLTHMAHARGFVRHPFVRSPERMGGRLSLWGLSTPRPPVEELRSWPYDFTELSAHFDAVEAEMGVHDAIPLSIRKLEQAVFARLAGFSDANLRVAPLAIDRDGKRFCPLEFVTQLAGKHGIRLLPRFRSDKLHREGDRIVAAEGTSSDGKSWTILPKIVVLAVGVEHAMKLISPIQQEPFPIRASDHHRIDLHGWLPPGSFGEYEVDDLGVAVLLMECESGDGVPFHLEIKVAPCGLWRRGYMQSSDNLSASHSDDVIYIQVQAVGAMHDRIPLGDLLNAGGALPPVMSHHDALLHGEIVRKMLDVSRTLGLEEPTFSLRPMLTNHHCYGAYRVGEAVTKEFRLVGCDNLFVLPPTSYVQGDDDANPTLKSCVLSRYAMDEIAEQLFRLRETSFQPTQSRI